MEVYFNLWKHNRIAIWWGYVKLCSRSLNEFGLFTQQMVESFYQGKSEVWMWNENNVEFFFVFFLIEIVI